MDTNWKAMLEVMIDKNSLAKAEKKLARERLKIPVDLELSNFASANREMKNQVTQLASALQKAGTSTKLQNYLSENISLTKTARKSVQEWIRTIQSADALTSGELSALNTKFTELTHSFENMALPETAVSSFEKLKNNLDASEKAMHSFEQAAAAALNTLNAYRLSKEEAFSGQMSTQSVSEETSGSKALSFLKDAAGEGLSKFTENYA